VSIRRQLKITYVLQFAEYFRDRRSQTAADDIKVRAASLSFKTDGKSETPEYERMRHLQHDRRNIHTLYARGHIKRCGPRNEGSKTFRLASGIEAEWRRREASPFHDSPAPKAGAQQISEEDGKSSIGVRSAAFDCGDHKHSTISV
jgi:uncharacterized protein YciI